MHGSHPLRLNRISGQRSKADKRRPSGVSRRRKRAFSFERLEARQVMTASSPLAVLSALGGNVAGVPIESQSYSSNTAAGQLDVLAREFYWQSLIEATGASSGARAVRSMPSDPLLGAQWHLINVGQNVGSPDWQPIYGVPGQDINVAPVWNQGYTGRGVSVAVIDSGVQLNHPDLAANIDLSLGFDALLLGPGNGSPDNAVLNPLLAHGTAVAGLIGAVANNGIGGTGVAPGATLVPIRLVDTGLTEQAVVDAFRHTIFSGIDITNNSWGPVDNRSLGAPSAAELLALRDSIIYGRNGLGVIHVWASGNGAGPDFNVGFPSIGAHDTSNYDGYANSRYTIAVTGVDHDGLYYNTDGTVTAYPEAGANVLVAAPTGSVSLTISSESDIGSGLVTTDLTGNLGFNAAVDPVTGQELNDPFYPAARDFLSDPDYTSRFNGTSGAAPIVSGVIALMLEANPNLTWRDVQEILVRSARQNSETDIPTVGHGTGLIYSQNLWIINQQPLFRDPDPFGTVGDPLTETLNPTLTPSDAGLYANGAGYTVSQGFGVYGEQIGYGHGVIDAEMAVQLAEQWTTKGQTLSPELTFTTFVFPIGTTPINIPAAERSNNDSSNQFVPGGIGGMGGFIDFWNEYFADDPFSDDNPPMNTRGSFLSFEVPPENAMSVETVDVKLSIQGATSEFLDHVRVTLVSPDGTHSELNHFFYDPPAPSTVQTLVPGSFSGSPGSAPADGPMVWTFTTKRHWGERSDGLWQVHIENYDSNDSFGLAGIEVAWHGNPIGANTQRIMGFVGVDENQDDAFQFSRAAETPEPWARNATVTLRRASDNALVKQFVTGHDGNFYFDVVPDNYVMTVEDPQGRTAVDDSINATPQYLSVWNITPADFAAVSNEGFNFLLDPGPPPAQQAVFTGTVYADINGDGQFNGDDVALPNITVFNDANRNGLRDAGEATALTSSVLATQGQYTLTVPITAASVVNIAVQRPTQWTSTNDLPGSNDSRTDGVESFFVRPGDSVSGITFSIDPPANNVGGGGASQPGILLGVVYEDTNTSLGRNAGELGAANVTVYLDNNNSGTLDAGDVSTVTNVHGAFAFTNVPPGQRLVRIVLNSPLTQTTPAPGTGRTITLTGSSTVSNIQFGIKNSALYDFGDLPAIYGATLLSENGARHKKGAYWLGATIDTELDGKPSANADGDDLFLPQMDEDGITFGAIVPGQTATIVATASRNNGVLQGWVDWNNDGDFNDVGERIFTDVALNAGANTLSFNVPASASVAQVYARFRYGEHSLGFKAIGTPFGEATLGEVEDYQLDVDLPVVRQTQGLPADADADGDVDGNDFLLWQRHVGMTSGATQAQGDSTGDDIVNGSDLTRWKAAYGDSIAPAATAPGDGDFDGDGDIDGNDFLMLQRSVGLGHPSQGSTAVSVWSDQFGGGAAAAAVLAESLTTSAVTSLSNFASAGATAAASPGETAPAASSNESYVTLASRVDASAGLSLRTFTEGRPAARGAYQSAEPQADAFVQLDRAFDDLFGTRRRQGLLAAAGGELAGDDVDCDDVFAALADHFERPVG